VKEQQGKCRNHWQQHCDETADQDPEGSVDGASMAGPPASISGRSGGDQQGCRDQERVDDPG